MTENLAMQRRFLLAAALLLPSSIVSAQAADYP